MIESKEERLDPEGWKKKNAASGRGKEITWPQKEKSKCGGDIYGIRILAKPGITHWRYSNIYGLIACWHPSKILSLNMKDIWCLVFWRIFSAFMWIFAIVQKQPTDKLKLSFKKYVLMLWLGLPSKYWWRLINIPSSSLYLFSSVLRPLESFLSSVLATKFNLLILQSTNVYSLELFYFPGIFKYLNFLFSGIC